MSYMTFDIQSSAVERMAYDTDCEELTIVYAGGGEYRYMDVPFNVAIAASEADSVGQYVNQNIKGVYESYDPSLRITADEAAVLIAEADRFNEKLSSHAAMMDDSDPVTPVANDLLNALDAFSNKLEKMFSVE